MGLFEQFPYTNFHGLNLKWILDRMVEFETRLTTAEGKISSLEDRMDTAESDIDALEARMDTAEGDIDALEGRMIEAEGDIDDLESCCTAMQSQVPASAAGDAGKVLTATGAGTAVWRTPLEPVYVTFDADNPPDPTPYIEQAIAGHPIYLRGTEGQYCYPLPLAFYRNGETHKWLVFNDFGGQFMRQIVGQDDAAVGFWQIHLRKTGDVVTWYEGQMPS